MPRPLPHLTSPAPDWRLVCVWWLWQVRQLHENANYFRRTLLDMGLHVLGDWDSPVMPIMIYQPGATHAGRGGCEQNLRAYRGQLLCIRTQRRPLLALLQARSLWCHGFALVSMDFEQTRCVGCLQA